ncbi:hypothetical protein TELCIR_00403 [Teladorsagia circumcincta]|uniref:Uncharacterized protein n=1 Tax=Teladorsagia circumcincta TaxID=45464 RepID=A0A2G9V4U3_TELCI|nr:hypothetical protein TELCIR_00403 [Teladorsagia circumcincta]
MVSRLILVTLLLISLCTVEAQFGFFGRPYGGYGRGYGGLGRGYGGYGRGRLFYLGPLRFNARGRKAEETKLGPCFGWENTLSHPHGIEKLLNILFPPLSQNPTCNETHKNWIARRGGGGDNHDKRQGSVKSN